ncbi:unnamed protein product [Prorocentrum cordatum]|uniref:UMP-CMP kinase n=1 Tax=Prorocentrum cordatum TaxID=2364126 RepID=A0ABN9PBB4_9DINO|nr:unnamed protein product [Polarella glacialis]
MQDIRDDIIEAAQAKVSSVGPVPEAPSITHSAKKIKDLLTEDPSNLELILRLGLAYAQDGAWLKCGNVLQRGWARAGELEDPAERAAYAATLAEALHKQGQHRGALQALLAADEPAEKGARRRHFSLLCGVRCALGEAQAALRELCRAIEGQAFEDVLTVWAATRSALRGAGVFDGARGAVARAAATEEDRVRLSTLDDLADATAGEAGRDRPPGGGRRAAAPLHRLRISAMLLGQRAGVLARAAFAAAGRCCQGRRHACRAQEGRLLHPTWEHGRACGRARERRGEYLSLLTAADQEHLASKGFEDCAVSAFAAAAGTQERLGSGGELGTALCAALGALPQMQTAMASELKAPAAASHLLAAYRAELDSLTVDRFPDMVRFALAYRIHCYFETSRLQKVEVHRSASAGPQVVFVLGGPGAGKGTQCTRISEAFGFHHLSAGDLLREERARPGSEYGELIESYIREGKLVPVDITVKLLEAAMKQRGWADGKFLIDGFPRSKENLEGWDRVIGDQATVKFALFFDLPEACMEERLLERGKTSGRSDDNIESIRKRFRTFQQESVPVAEHLASRDLLKRVSAEESVEEVWHNVQAIFGPTVVFVLGGPGSGKGTLCSRITQAFGYAHLSAGDLLREERQRPSSEYGELIESHIREGKLVPAEITVNLLLRRMRETGWEGGKYLVDGFPRSSSNLEAWEQAVQGRVFVKFGIYLECSMGAMEERLLRRGQTSGRSDDNIEVIRKRFMTFHSESMPIVEKLQAEGMLRKVDAEKSPDEVWKQVQPLFGPSVVFVLGGPGSGKGTVCARIAGTFNYHHLSVGDLLRDERNRPGSKYGELIEGCIRDGKLVPVEIVVKLLRNAMWAKGWERGKYLIDGFPRSAENMEGWTSVVGDQVNVQFALHLDATRETMEARILERGKTSGRSDDNAETLRKRFDTFQQESVPVLHAFEAQGRLRRVNSEKSVDEVWHSAKMLFAPTVIFVLGGPGAGKGTQCERIAGQFGFHHLSAGDLLRAERKRPGSEMGELIEGYIRDGKLVPVDITVQLLQKAMEERGWEGGRYLVDGFPRSADNMEGWQRILGDKVNVKFCLFFECSEATMERRLLDRGKSSGRSDDNAATIRKRFQTFSAETVPIVAHFQQQGRLRRVDSEQEVEDVWASVREVMSFEMNPHMPNQALVFLKPHAHNPQAERFLQSYLVTHGIAVLDRGAVSASELAERGLFDAHYSQLAANASADPGALQVPPRGQEAFEQRFGVAWHDAVGSAAVLPATEAGARLQMTNQQLLEAWDAAGPLKLAPSLYVARLTSPAAPQAEAFVVNAFLCQQRDSFLKGGEGLLWLVVEFDPAVISWGKFRSDICGSTNPSKAPEESIRGQFYRHWEALGLDGMPSTMNNAVHASAGPLEALRERLLWTGAKLEQDPLGRSLLAAGVPPGTVELWMGNPGVDRWPDGLRSQGGPIFDCTEDHRHRHRRVPRVRGQVCAEGGHSTRRVHAAHGAASGRRARGRAEVLDAVAAGLAEAQGNDHPPLQRRIQRCAEGERARRRGCPLRHPRARAQGRVRRPRRGGGRGAVQRRRVQPLDDVDHDLRQAHGARAECHRHPHGLLRESRLRLRRRQPHLHGVVEQLPLADQQRHRQEDRPPPGRGPHHAHARLPWQEDRPHWARGEGVAGDPCHHRPRRRGVRGLLPLRPPAGHPAEDPAGRRDRHSADPHASTERRAARPRDRRG